MTAHTIVAREQWRAAREALLVREKAHTRMGDELARQRRELPWVRVDKEYRFDTEEGPRSLAELFDGRSQLLVYHFMFGPSYQARDPVNSSIADSLDALVPHLQARDVTPVHVSQAPLEKLQAYRRRMGWRLAWVSAATSDFYVDFGASATQEQVPPGEGGLPPIVAQNAAAAGTDVGGYLSQAPAVSVLPSRTASSTRAMRPPGGGWSFLMGYYPILDRMPRAATKATAGNSGSGATTSTATADAYGRRGKPSQRDRGWLGSAAATREGPSHRGNICVRRSAPAGGADVGVGGRCRSDRRPEFRAVDVARTHATGGDLR